MRAGAVWKWAIAELICFNGVGCGSAVLGNVGLDGASLTASPNLDLGCAGWAARLAIVRPRHGRLQGSNRRGWSNVFQLAPISLCTGKKESESDLCVFTSTAYLVSSVARGSGEPAITTSKTNLRAKQTCGRAYKRRRTRTNFGT